MYSDSTSRRRDDFVGPSTMIEPVEGNWIGHIHIPGNLLTSFSIFCSVMYYFYSSVEIFSS